MAGGGFSGLLLPGWLCFAVVKLYPVLPQIIVCLSGIWWFFPSKSPIQREYRRLPFWREDLRCRLLSQSREFVKLCCNYFTGTQIPPKISFTSRSLRRWRKGGDISRGKVIPPNTHTLFGLCSHKIKSWHTDLLVTHVNATHVFTLRAISQSSHAAPCNSRGPRGRLGIDTRGEISCQTPEDSVGGTGKPWRETKEPGMSVCPKRPWSWCIN